MENGMDNGMENKEEILLEIKQIGNMIKVTAIDAATGLEASFGAPANTPAEAVRELARRKMAYIKSKNQKTGNLSVTD